MYKFDSDRNVIGQKLLVRVIAQYILRKLFDVKNIRACLNRYLTPLLLCVAIASESQELKVPTQTDLSLAQRFFVGLLNAALEEGADGRPIPHIREVGFMEQDRIVLELQRGKLIDIYWFGATKEREKALRIIPIPLMRGLLGYRRFVIRKSDEAKFNQVQTLLDLQQYTACQGIGWPDAEIMRMSGLRVITSRGVDNIYHQLANGRCDYFPRGYFEVFTEMDERKKAYPNLMVYQTLVLHYPFSVNFFVQKENVILEKWITSGLERMIDNGSFELYIRSNPFTKTVFPLKLSERFCQIDIPNPYLSEMADINNSRYWILPKDWARPVLENQ